MKIAIFHNFLDNIGGAEVVSLILARRLKADVYTTNIDKGKIIKMGFEDVLPRIFSIGSVPINAPFRQQMALFRFSILNLKDKYNFYIICGDWAMSGAKNNKPNLWYVHSPIREIWDLKNYTKNNLVSWWKKPLFEMWVFLNRNLNRKYLKSVEKIVCNSENTKNRVEKYLKREAEIISPPIDTKKFHYNKTGNFWISVNRLIPHKRIEIQLKAFEKIPKEKLIIVGSYEQSRHFQKYAEYCKKIKPKNVEIKSWVDHKDLISLYANCKGFIATSKDEDFGMNVVEAMASGKPVIAPNEGGYKETVINGKTGILIDDINEDKLVEAVKSVDLNLKNDKTAYKKECLAQAVNFDTGLFIENIKEAIASDDKKNKNNFLIKSSVKIVSHKYKFIWFALAKNGSSSIKNVFSKLLKTSVDNLPRLQGPSSYLQYPKYFKFAIVRNPWDRLVSCYFNKIKDVNFVNKYFNKGIPTHFERFGVFKASMPFGEFVKAVASIPDDIADSHFRSQYAEIANRKGELVVDFVGRFENLSEDFNTICRKLNLPEKINLPHINKTSTKKDHYSKYYTEELIKIVEERYKEDIKRFGYKFEAKKEEKTDKNKIAIFHDYFRVIGGAEKLVLTLAKELKADIITSEANTDCILEAGFGNDNIIPLGELSKFSFFLPSLCKKRFQECDFSDKYSKFIFSGNFSIYAAKKHKPNIWYCHTPLRGLYDLKNENGTNNILKNSKS